MHLDLFGRRLELALKSLPLTPLTSRGGGWRPAMVIHEPFTGAWQVNADVPASTALTYAPVFACATLIAADIGKLHLGLVEQDAAGIWTDTESAAFSPVLRKPNRYQTKHKFIEQWIVSKLIWGNTYVLKERDARGVVVALYILDPARVRVLVSPDGSVFYQLDRDDLSGLPQEGVTIPAREIIHDTMVALYHPLIGVSPIYACALATTQGLSIQNSSSKFFANGSSPGGLLIAPGPITTEQATTLKAKWQAEFSGENAGKVAVIQGDMKYEQLHVNAVDAQLLEQLQWSGETICSCFHVPAYMVGIGPHPPYGSVGALVQQYYAQCLQSLMVNLEVSLDEGLGLGPQFGNRYGTEFNPEDLIWLDTDTRTKAAQNAIASAAMSPDEARLKYFGLGPVDGGGSPYMQQQNFSLAALAERDADKPFAKAKQPQPPPPAAPPPVVEDVSKGFAVALSRAAQERYRRAS